MAFGQSNLVVTNVTADAIMAGNYTPSNYTKVTSIITPNAISPISTNQFRRIL